MSATPDVDIESLDLHRLLQEANDDDGVSRHVEEVAQQSTPMKDPMAQFNLWIREASTPVHGTSTLVTPTPANPISVSGVSASPYTGGFGTPQVVRPWTESAMPYSASPFGGFASINRMEGAHETGATRLSPVGHQMTPLGGYSLFASVNETANAARLLHTPTRISPLARQPGSPDWFGASASSMGPPTDGSNRAGVQPLAPSRQYSLNATATPNAPQVSIEDLVGRMVEAAKDQTGCRCLQQVLDLPFDSTEVQSLLHEIFPSISELMADQYGNFLIQKLLDVSPDAVRLSITQSIAPSLPVIAMTQHGTFAVQKLIESFRSDDEANIALNGLAGGVVGLMKDPFGGHVVQKVLSCLRPEQHQFLFDGLAANIVEICTDKQGCCVAQRCIESASVEQRNLVLRYVMSHWSSLVSHPYGNYVVQFCMVNIPNGANYLVELLLHGARLAPTVLVAVGTNKFGSNVLERALTFCSQDAAARLIQRLSHPDTLGPLVMDSFGNYVIQTALTQAPLQALPHLLAAITPNISQIRSQNYGRKFETKLDAARDRVQHQIPPPAPDARTQRSVQGGKGTPIKSPQHHHAGGHGPGQARVETGCAAFMAGTGSPLQKPQRAVYTIPLVPGVLAEEAGPSSRRMAPAAVDGNVPSRAFGSVGPGSINGGGFLGPVAPSKGHSDGRAIPTADTHRHPVGGSGYSRGPAPTPVAMSLAGCPPLQPLDH